MTIINKLNLNKYVNMAVLGEPDDYAIFDGYKTTLAGEHDAIFVFVETIDEMVEHTRCIIKEEQLLEKGVNPGLSKRLGSLYLFYEATENTG